MVSAAPSRLLLLLRTPAARLRCVSVSGITSVACCLVNAGSGDTVRLFFKQIVLLRAPIQTGGLAANDS